ncbi:MAG: transposase [Candidatus Stahlbacteria bacterium]|nr:transposase [Candidatus Stahlbacteria bacterium]
MYRNLPKFNDGTVHFVTTKTYQNIYYFSDNVCCDILIEELDFYRRQYKFKIVGYVITPDHFHILVWWDVDENKSLTISKIMQGIESHSAKRILESLELRKQIRSGQGTQPTHSMIQSIQNIIQPQNTLLSPNTGRQGPLTLSKEYPHRRISNPEYKIWQSGFYDFNIISAHKFSEKLNYIHNNPFIDKRIDYPENYPYSSRLFYETGNGILRIDLS